MGRLSYLMCVLERKTPRTFLSFMTGRGLGEGEVTVTAVQAMVEVLKKRGLAEAGGGDGVALARVRAPQRGMMMELGGGGGSGVRAPRRGMELGGGGWGGVALARVRAPQRGVTRQTVIWIHRWRHGLRGLGRLDGHQLTQTKVPEKGQQLGLLIGDGGSGDAAVLGKVWLS